MSNMLFFIIKKYLLLNVKLENNKKKIINKIF